MLTACDHNEKKLLARIAQDDAEAFTRLFHLYRNRIYSIAHRISGSDSLAEEVVQDIFMKVWLKRSDLTKVSNFPAWLHTVTSHHLFSLLKRRVARERKEISLESALVLDTTDTEQTILHRDLEAILNRAISSLPTQQNKVFRLIKVYGFKKEEVASRLNLSTETVKVHLTKAIKNIRAYCVNHMDLLLLLWFFV